MIPGARVVQPTGERSQARERLTLAIKFNPWRDTTYRCSDLGYSPTCGFFLRYASAASSS